MMATQFECFLPFNGCFLLYYFVCILYKKRKTFHPLSKVVKLTFSLKFIVYLLLFSSVIYFKTFIYSCFFEFFAAISKRIDSYVTKKITEKISKRDKLNTLLCKNHLYILKIKLIIR